MDIFVYLDYLRLQVGHTARRWIWHIRHFPFSHSNNCESYAGGGNHTAGISEPDREYAVDF
jgi:hypothetical protein